MGVYNNNVSNIESSMTQRYFLCKDGDGYRPAFDVRASAFKTDELKEFQKIVLSNMPKLPVMTRKETVALYHGHKQVVYEKARLSLDDKPLSVEDSYLKSFSKFEKVDVSKPPRNISPRETRYNLELARYLKHAEHHFFKAINKAFRGRTRATVIKGLNADVSAQVLYEKWILFLDPVAIGLDASKFDMHVTVRALLYEHSFYNKLFPRNSKLRQLLKWQLKNQGIAYADDGSVRFEIVGTRSSGDINTSLGNCILMCSMVWAYAKSLGIDCELANNGDDCVVILERVDADKFRDRLSAWFKVRGFAMTVEDTVDEFEQIEFCQTHPVKLSTGWRMVRNIKAVVEKDPMCLVPINGEKALQKWLYAVGTCGSILTSGVPVLSNFYNAFLRSGVECSDGMMSKVFEGRSQLSLGQGVATAQVDSEARCSFYYAFGIGPDEQRSLERYYDNLTVDLSVGPVIKRTELVCNPGGNIISIVQQEE